MRIAIFSDTHLGFGRGEERHEDAFDALAEAIEKSLGCDAILIAGDIFDSQHPDAETFSRAIECLAKAILSEKSVESVTGIGKNVEKLNPMCHIGIPVIALHGNHERRAKGLVNPVHALEKAGFLIHLHANGVILEKGREKVAIQGLSAVPEAYLDEALRQWDPKPIKGCYNILMLHQIIEGFAYGHRPLSLDKIPKGFDLMIDGDIHERHADRGRRLLIAGSTIATKLDKKAEEPKGIWVLDTAKSDTHHVPFERQRKIYFIEAGNAKREEMEKMMDGILKEKHEKKPLIRVKHNSLDDFSQHITEKYAPYAIISFRKDAIEEIKEGKLQVQMPTITEMGKSILRDNLLRKSLEPQIFEAIFELLYEGREEDAARMVEEYSRNRRKMPVHANASGGMEAKRHGKNLGDFTMSEG